MNKYYNINDNSFFEIVDKMEWNVASMNDNNLYDKDNLNDFIVSTTRCIIGFTSVSSIKDYDKDDKLILNVTYYINLNTNKAYMIYNNPEISNTNLTPNIYTCNIENYLNEFYLYFKKFIPLYKIEIDNTNDFLTDVYKKYAITSEEVIVNVTSLINYMIDEEIVLYVNNKKYTNSENNSFTFEMPKEDVKLTFKIEKINNKIQIDKYYNEQVLSNTLQNKIIKVYENIVDIPSSESTYYGRISRCYGVYEHNSSLVIPVLIESSFDSLESELKEEIVGGCTVRYPKNNSLYVYYNNYLYSLTKVYELGYLEYNELSKISSLSLQDNNKTIKMINSNLLFTSENNTMNRLGGEIIRSFDEYNTYIKENEITITSDKGLLLSNAYLTDNFYLTKSLIIMPIYYYTYDPSFIFLETGVFIDRKSNIVYLDTLFNLSKQESSIINTYYFMFEIDKDVVEKISRVYFRDPLSLKTTYSFFQEHSLSFDNYDYLFK